MELLCGWKEIAEYMHLTVRTAQRWQRVGLPVRRAYESQRSPVLAAQHELEQWLSMRETRRRRRPSESQRRLVSEFRELRSAQRRTHRVTRTLVHEVTQLRMEQQRLIDLIRANLTATVPPFGRCAPGLGHSFKWEVVKSTDALCISILFQSPGTEIRFRSISRRAASISQKVKNDMEMLALAAAVLVGFLIMRLNKLVSTPGKELASVLTAEPGHASLADFGAWRIQGEERTSNCRITYIHQ